MKSLASLLLLVIILFPAAGSAQEETRLLRFPAIHGDQVVFTYAGDLYTVSTEGGVARKLTSHDGYEMFARFSPDGNTIAFTGQYDGNTEVYLMPAQGGIPTRLTWTATLGRDDVADRMGPNNIVIGWKHSGNEIVMRSRMRSYNSFIGQLFSVALDGGLPQQLPVPRGGFCSFSPDDSKMAYNRVFREFRTWKRYRGGMADDIWVYDFNTNKIENITENPAQDIIPMWHGDNIYFLSDRDDLKRMNLFVYNTVSMETRQLTHYAEFDIKFPSLGNDAIVFENGGYLYRFDLATESTTKIPVVILEDFAQVRGGIASLSDKVSNFEIAPDGNRALFGARGEIFTVPVKNGPTRNLTGTPGIHERNSKWSPNGTWIAYISDATGEDEIYLVAQDGSGKPRQLTRDSQNYKYQIYWSPDSRKLLWADKNLRLRYVDTRTGAITEVDSSKAWEFGDYSWAPDSKWIAYQKYQTDSPEQIYLYSLENKKSFPVTDTWYSSSSPVFSSDGKYLFFVSNRDFNPTYSWTEWNHSYQDMQNVYFVTLDSSTESPFRPKSDEVKIGSEKKEEPKESADEKVVVTVDTENLSDRILSLQLTASAYFNISVQGNSVYYQRAGSKDDKPVLIHYALDEQKETELGPINGYEISADGKKMLVSQNGNYGIIDLPKSKIELSETLDLSGMRAEVIPYAEWQQIFNESWRQMRDFFYVPNMHGVDWEAVREKYAPLVGYANHRNDLTYVIGEMIGELNVGHAYVGGGDRPSVNRIKTGLLGAELTRDVQTGFYRIDRILPGQNWSSDLRSPLTEMGVAAKQGEYIISVDGVSCSEINNFFEAMLDKAGKQVVLELNSKPEAAGSRKVTIIPIDDESQLYYHDWVQSNIRKVSEATDGKVGYLHVPDMGRAGLNEFVKYFYPQIRKKALIIDVRGNGGGNVSPMLIERLRREIAMVTFARNTEPGPNPDALVYGPMVCLADEFSASDGDLFTYRFKKHGLGKVIGKRTWGGVVGIRGSLPFIDGGTLNKPEFSRYDVAGQQWIIEGVGVEPDIFVDNDPWSEFNGIDDQLNKAIEVIQEELKQSEKEIPSLPPYPVR
jgi:tricorn protease